MTKKKDIPKSQLRRKFPRCVRCNSSNVRYSKHAIETGYFDENQIFERQCLECDIVQWVIVGSARKILRTERSEQITKTLMVWIDIIAWYAGENIINGKMKIIPC